MSNGGEIVPTAEKSPVEWAYTTQPLAKGWFQPGFDDSQWERGPAPLGTVEPEFDRNPGTVWKTPDPHVPMAVHAAWALGGLGAVEALPTLRSKAGVLSLAAEQVKKACAQAIAKLEAWAKLPRPAEAPEPEIETLPRPAYAPEPDEEALPRLTGEPEPNEEVLLRRTEE